MSELTVNVIGLAMKMSFMPCSLRCSPEQDITPLTWQLWLLATWHFLALTFPSFDLFSLLPSLHPFHSQPSHYCIGLLIYFQPHSFMDYVPPSRTVEKAENVLGRWNRYLESSGRLKSQWNSSMRETGWTRDGWTIDCGKRCIVKGSLSGMGYLRGNANHSGLTCSGGPVNRFKEKSDWIQLKKYFSCL